ncbi:MAG: ketoacyl-ACP synthase III [Bacteroidetes bacterium]|nr:MAG: ketoacyl-ACP synthase III [Bacteroidota bacterium]
MLASVITGTGSYIPEKVKTNNDFSAHVFYDVSKTPLTTDPAVVVKKFGEITGIHERRYALPQHAASDLAAKAAEAALASSGVDPETLDYIVVAHNFGDVLNHANQSDAVPSLANRVKHALAIKNPACVAFDILFGCPGWLQAMIQAEAFIKAGMAKKCLLIGTETLSRVIDRYDRDSMIFSDGAGACVLEARQTNDQSGILSTCAQSHSNEEAYYIDMGCSYLPDNDPKLRFIKMQGRRVYEYAMTHVPPAMKQCLDSSGVNIADLKMVFLHQANEKMDEGIIKRFYKLYGVSQLPENVMPMSIHWLGNSSVATIPTLFDLVRRQQVPGFDLQPGDVVLFASVGAGMNINAVCYRC